MTAARKGYTCELLVLLQILSFNIKNTAKDKNKRRLVQAKEAERDKILVLE